MRMWFAILVLFQGVSLFAQGTAPVRFSAIDVYVDSGERPLAAYQVEFRAKDGAAKIAGIEGGEAAPFKDPPHYDPKAIQRERVIIAAFSTESAAGLPNGKTRVATIHVQVTGAAIPDYAIRIETAADNNAKRIAARATFEIRKQL